MREIISRLLVEAVARRYLREMRNDPERGIRNLMDMALQFSEGRFQKSLFRAARTLLEKEDSAYYGLVRDTLAHVEDSRLLTFGMNLGYNGCTAGARHIRENEGRLRCRIPWIVTFRLEPETFARHRLSYHTAIREGEGLGIHCWILAAARRPQAFLELAARHPDSAFFLFCNPGEITGPLRERLIRLPNVMPVVRLEKAAGSVYAGLRDAGLLYSLYAPYHPESWEDIRSGSLFRRAQRHAPFFTVLAAGPTCSPALRQAVHQAAAGFRASQEFRTIPWELSQDNQLVDAMISDDACTALFDTHGRLCIRGDPVRPGAASLFQLHLPDIFQSCFGRAPAAAGASSGPQTLPEAYCFCPEATAPGHTKWRPQKS